MTLRGGKISAGIQSAIAKLKHKDIRHRRRAIRVLFEANDPNNLHAFEAMLNDEDPWFRGKALEAYRNWAPYQEASSLDPLIDSTRIEANRTASTILEKMNTDCTKQAMKLIESDDISAVKFAAMYMARKGTGELNKELMHHQNSIVRREVVSSPSLNNEDVKKMLGDEDDIVFKNCIRELNNRNVTLTDKELDDSMNREVGKIELVPILLKNKDSRVGKATLELNTKEQKEFLSLLSKYCDSSDHPAILSIHNSGNKNLLSRWIVRKQGNGFDKFREMLIFDSSIDIVQRVRLVETLVGRPNDEFVQNLVEKILASKEHDLLVQEAHMLSTASEEI